MFGPSRKQLYRELTRRTEHYERVIADLNDRLANAYGRPWNVPPADLQDREMEKVERLWTPTPEQESLS